MAHTTTVRLGLTQSDRSGGYVAALDGWQAFAPQTVLDVEVLTSLVVGKSIEAIAEAAFIATNAPTDVVEGDRLSAAIFSALFADGAPRSLSVGDTVEVDGTRVACARFGWERITA